MTLANMTIAVCSMGRGTHVLIPVPRRRTGSTNKQDCPLCVGSYFDIFRMIFLNRVPLIGWSATTFPS